MAEINMFEKTNIIPDIAKMVYYLVVQVAGEIHNSYGTIYNGICTFFWISRR